MGLAGSPCMFQERMTNFVGDLEHARACLDDLLCLARGTFEDHLDKLDEVFHRLLKAGLRVSAKKCVFCKDQVEHLGFCITRNGIKLADKKVKAILDLDRPKNLHDARRVLGMVQHYRDLWQKRSHALAPLSDLVGELSPKTKSGEKGNKKKKKTLKRSIWAEEHEKAFICMKKIVSREVILACPNFNK